MKKSKREKKIDAVLKACEIAEFGRYLEAKMRQLWNDIHEALQNEDADTVGPAVRNLAATMQAKRIAAIELGEEAASWAGNCVSQADAFEAFLVLLRPWIPGE